MILYIHSVSTLRALDALLAYLAGESHVRAAAALALRDLITAPGPAAGSCVADTLDIKDKQRVIVAAQLLLSDPLEPIRKTGVEILHPMTPSGVPSVFAQVLTMLKDIVRSKGSGADLRQAAVTALHQLCGPLGGDPRCLSVAEEVVQVLGDKHERAEGVKVCCIRLLADICPKACSVALLGFNCALRDTSNKVRETALRNAFRICGAAEQTTHPQNHHSMVTIVTMMLRDTQPSLRYHAMKALKEMVEAGTNSRGLVDAVLTGLKDSNAHVREAAFETMLHIFSAEEVEALNSGDGGMLQDLRRQKF
jgi:hypothetical protein